MAFSLDSIMNSQTLSQAKAFMAKDTHKVVYLNIDNIQPNPVNDKVKYSMNGIETLSYSIESAGLMEPLLVTPLNKEDKSDNAKYMLISGHRRRLAILAAIERNPDAASSLQYVPCIVRKNVITTGEDGTVKFLNEEEVIDGNVFNREKTPAERANELELKKELLLERKRNGEKISGKLIDLIAEELDISKVQAKKYNAINVHASDTVKEAFQSGELSTEAAYELSKNDTDIQDEIMEKHADDEEPITAKTVKIETGKERPAPEEDCNSAPEINPGAEGDLPYGKTLTDNEAEEAHTETNVSTGLENEVSTSDEAKTSVYPRVEIIARVSRLMKKFAENEDEVIFNESEIKDALETLNIVYGLI